MVKEGADEVQPPDAVNPAVLVAADGVVGAAEQAGGLPGGGAAGQQRLKRGGHALAATLPIESASALLRHAADDLSGQPGGDGEDLLVEEVGGLGGEGGGSRRGRAVLQ